MRRQFQFVDVRSKLLSVNTAEYKPLLDLLAYSMYQPTAEKIKERIASYQSPDTYVYTCVENSAYLGLIVYRLCKNVATVLDIAVHEGARRCGIGTFLMDGMMMTSRAAEVLAETDDDAVGFYQKYGFKIMPLQTAYDCKRYLCRYKEREKW